MTGARLRHTQAELAQLDAQIVEVLKADHPQSVRHAFYRMTDPRLGVPVEKTDAGYNLVQRRCLKLRRSGAMPYGWISDSTRRGYHVSTFTGGGEFIQRFASLYRSQLWTPDLPHVEVWCESRSLAGVLQAECKELAVSLYPAGGFASATLCFEAASEINRRAKGRAVILYLGDFDPSGVLIDQSIESELRGHLELPLEFRRLAINADQIAEYDLPTKPRKAGDKRRLDIAATVEAEAMPAGDMRRIVREAVEAYLPEHALAVAKVTEESERDGLRLLGQHVENYGLETVIDGGGL